MRKKPVFIVKNAHSLLAGPNNFDQKDNGHIPNGHLGKSAIPQSGSSQKTLNDVGSRTSAHMKVCALVAVNIYAKF